MKRSTSLKIIAGVFGALFVLAILNSLFQFTSDSLRFATGAIKTSEYTADTLTLKDFTKTENGTIISTSADPQLIIEDYNAHATLLRINFEFSKNPGEVNLYYTHGDEEFSDSNKIWGKARNDGSYEFIMPRGNLSRIRIDPASFENLEIKINSFTLNPSRTFMSYFYYSGESVFNYFIYGALLSCFIAFIYETFGEQISKFYFILRQRLLRKKI